MNEIKIDRFRLNDIIEAMCEDYCYYGATTTDPDVLQKHCDECPLNNITGEEE